MSSIRSKNTRPEIIFGKILWKNNLRYRKHYAIAGKPDFVIVSSKLAVFVDGDFWHGNNWKLRGIKDLSTELATYKKFWANKITNNIKRDQKANLILKKEGWKVFRFWESGIKRKPETLLKKVLKAHHARKPDV